MFTQKALKERIARLPPGQQESVQKFQNFLKTPFFNQIVGLIFGVVGMTIAYQITGVCF